MYQFPDKPTHQCVPVGALQVFSVSDRQFESVGVAKVGFEVSSHKHTVHTQSYTGVSVTASPTLPSSMVGARRSCDMTIDNSGRSWAILGTLKSDFTWTWTWIVKYDPRAFTVAFYGIIWYASEQASSKVVEMVSFIYIC